MSLTHHLEEGGIQWNKLPSSESIWRSAERPRRTLHRSTFRGRGCGPPRSPASPVGAQGRRGERTRPDDPNQGNCFVCGELPATSYDTGAARRRARNRPRVLHLRAVSPKGGCRGMGPRRALPEGERRPTRPDPLRDRGAALPRGAALRWADIETADGSVVAVTVRRSKTNQAGDPPAGGGRAGRGRCGHRSRRRPGEPPALRPACAAAGLEHGRYPWIPPKIGRPDGRNRALMDPEPSPPLRRARPRLAKSLSIARLPRRQPPREPATPQALSRRSEPTSYGLLNTRIFSLEADFSVQAHGSAFTALRFSSSRVAPSFPFHSFHPLAVRPSSAIRAMLGEPKR